MRDGVCPKCQSTDVYKGQLKNSNEMPIFVPKSDAVFTGTEIFNVVPYVCSACGYIEFLADDKSHGGQDRHEWFTQSSSSAWPKVEQPAKKGKK